MLSDESKRSQYDAHGKDGVDAPQFDLKQVVQMTFGGGAFDTIFGDVATIPMLQQIFSMVDDRSGRTHCIVR